MVPSNTLSSLETIANSLRRDVLHSTDAAGSGHPTSCLSCAELMASVFFDAMHFDVSQPERLDNDHFILSKGHAAPILWSVMHRAGALSRQEMMRLRTAGSRTEGHPTPHNEWVKVATGSLGQGLSAGLGMALADRLDGRRNRTYVLMGDGELAEGSCWEAAQLASHHHLNNVCALVDVNARGQTGPTMLGHDTEAYRRRFEAFDWQALVVDGHDVNAVREALEQARDERERPTVVLARTIKGAGVKHLEGAEGAHGKPAPDLEKALASLPEDEAEIPVAIKSPVSAPEFPTMPQISLRLTRSEELSTDPISPRKAFGNALVELGQKYGSLVVFDGEVSNSTYTQSFADEFPERFYPSFIAEQNMVGMALGAARQGHLPLVSTFAAFLTRAFDQIRMAGISQADLCFVGTHAGSATGEDGPSQMGLEDIAMFRTVPGSIVLQPADGPSTVGILQSMAMASGIRYLRLMRPSVPPLYDANAEFPVGGSHTLRHGDHDNIVFFASGHTVHTALAAADRLRDEGLSARVLDLYSIKPFDATTVRRAVDEIGTGIILEDHYPEGGLGEAISATVPLPPERWRHLAVREVPASGDPEALAEQLGLYVEHTVRMAKALCAATGL